MSNRYFSKNKKSYKRTFEIIKPKRVHVLEKLDNSIKSGDENVFESLIKSVDYNSLKESIDKIINSKKKLKL